MASDHREFSEGHVDTVCGPHVEAESSIPPVDSEQESVEVELEDVCVTSTSRNKHFSFKLPVTLWVYGKRTQTEALVDSGATANFIDKSFVERNHLVTNRLATPHPVKNVDGTPNADGPIREFIRAYMEIGSHKTENYFYVTNLGDKDMILGYKYLYEHNPTINWRTGEWEFSRCPDSCNAYRTRKIRGLEAGIDELHLPKDLPYESPLDDLGDEDSVNPIINWVDIDDPDQRLQAKVIANLFFNDSNIASLFDENSVDEELDRDDEDTTAWKNLILEMYHEFGDVFSKRKSERMPE